MAQNGYRAFAIVLVLSFIGLGKPEQLAAGGHAHAHDAETKVHDTTGNDDELQVLFGGLQHSGGYGGPVIRYSRMGRSETAFIGGRGGWIANRRLIIGGAGFGASTEVVSPDGLPRRASMGYGGLLLEYIFAPASVLHAKAGVLLGSGGISISDQASPREMHGNTNRSINVIEPELHAEVNVTRFFRVAAGATWRVVGGVGNAAGFTDADFSGPAASLMFQFGRF
jgi:hypothetical protein